VDSFNSLHMIAQHKLLRIRSEIDLILDIAHLEDPDIVFDQRERDNQGHESMMVIADHTPRSSAFSFAPSRSLKCPKIC